MFHINHSNLLILLIFLHLVPKPQLLYLLSCHSLVTEFWLKTFWFLKIVNQIWVSLWFWGWLYVAFGWWTRYFVYGLGFGIMLLGFGDFCSCIWSFFLVVLYFKMKVLTESLCYIFFPNFGQTHWSFFDSRSRGVSIDIILKKVEIEGRVTRKHCPIFLILHDIIVNFIKRALHDKNRQKLQNKKNTSPNSQQNFSKNCSFEEEMSQIYVCVCENGEFPKIRT